MAQQKCSPSEYHRMFREKADAAVLSGLTFMASGGRASIGSLLAPWHTRAKVNAKRLRRK
jgi:hypothetical protein